MIYEGCFLGGCNKGVTNSKIDYENLEFIPISQTFIDRFGLEFLGLNLFKCLRSSGFPNDLFHFVQGLKKFRRGAISLVKL